jgi:ABC-type microcin C transport system permease subunit YejB
MTQYILRRLFWMLPLLLGITVINYGVYALAPGDPVAALISPEEFRNLTKEDLAARGVDRQFGQLDPLSTTGDKIDWARVA